MRLLAAGLVKGLFLFPSLVAGRPLRNRGLIGGVDGEDRHRRRLPVYVSVLTAQDLKILDDAFHAALDEAIESNVKLSLTALTLRLCDAYLTGERDLQRLVHAAVFQNRPRSIQ